MQLIHLWQNQNFKQNNMKNIFNIKTEQRSRTTIPQIRINDSLRQDNMPDAMKMPQAFGGSKKKKA